MKARTREISKHEQLMDEVKSGTILKSVPEQLRPCPEIKSLETAKGIKFGIIDLNAHLPMGQFRHCG